MKLETALDQLEEYGWTDAAESLRTWTEEDWKRCKTNSPIAEETIFIEDWLNSVFSWELSKEGHDYWEAVYDNIIKQEQMYIEESLRRKLT